MSHKLLRPDSTEQLITGKVEALGREMYAYVQPSNASSRAQSVLFFIRPLCSPP